MRLVRFKQGDEVRFGHLQADCVVPLAAGTFVEALTASPQGESIPLGEVALLSPVEKPGKILGIGVNYAAHAAESVSFIDTKKPEVQKWFNKQVTAVNGPYADVHLPKVSEQLDYEGELVVIIGKHGRHVPRERAFEIVAGVTVGCDYSVRDWQRASQTMITLEPGDVIFPGTPAGVGAGHEPPKWLKVGDKVRVEIDCLGFTENEIVREPGDTVIG